MSKHILLGITGGIAAYKSCELVRLLKKQGHSVSVVMTDSATEFVSPLTGTTLPTCAILSNWFQTALPCFTQTVANRLAVKQVQVEWSKRSIWQIC